MTASFFPFQYLYHPLAHVNLIIIYKKQRQFSHSIATVHDIIYTSIRSLSHLSHPLSSSCSILPIHSRKAFYSIDSHSNKKNKNNKKQNKEARIERKFHFRCCERMEIKKKLFSLSFRSFFIRTFLCAFTHPHCFILLLKEIFQRKRQCHLKLFEG